MAAINDKLAEYLGKGCDICEHLETIKKYASECDHVTEFGIRTGVSTTAIIAGKPKRFVTYDIDLGRFNAGQYCEMAKEVGVDLVVIEGNSVEVEIEETDMLMIDSEHTHEHMTKELSLHGGKVSKYIISHDTEKFKHRDEARKDRGLWDALHEFMDSNPGWELREHFPNNNGLTVIQRKT